ncbi:murein hydrolase activator EnvC family protein [Nautilia sp.]
MINPVFLILLSVFLFSATLNHTTKELRKTSYKIARMNKKLDALAKEILKKQAQVDFLAQKQKRIGKEISVLEKELKNSSKTLNELNDLAKGLNRNKENIKAEIIRFISQNYYLDTKQTDSLNDLIYSEINEKALEEYSKRISMLVKNYKKIDKTLKIVNKKISDIKNKKNMLERKRRELLSLKKERLKELYALKRQKESYKKKLLSMIKKQKILRKTLQHLKIVKKRESVKKYGSAYYKPETAVYKGVKTIPPVHGNVVKRFGSYVDPIYKIKIYNDSITIKTKKNSVVRAIMDGRVVYIGDSGDKKVVFVKHRGNLFSIYANLTKISPLLKKGSYVKRGQIIARVDDSLEFEVTYKDKPINPLKVISLR